MATGKIDKNRLRRAENRLFATAAKTQGGGSRQGLKASGSHYNAEMDAAFAKREVNIPDVVVAVTP